MSAAVIDLEGARPSVWNRMGFVAMYAGFTAICALVVAVPCAALAGGAFGGFSNGDATLFEPGGVFVFEAARRNFRSIWPIASAGFAIGAAEGAAALIPLAMLIAALATPVRPRLFEVASHGVKRFGALFFLFAIARAASGVALTVLVLIANKIVDPLKLVGMREIEGRTIAVAIAFALTLVLGVVHDLARVVIVTGDVGLLGGIRGGFRAFRSAPLRSTGAYAWRTVLGWAAIAAGFWIAPPLAPLGASLVLVFLVHQGAFFFANLMRASWLVSAIGVVARATHEPIAVASAPITPAPPVEPVAVESAPAVVEGASEPVDVSSKDPPAEG